MAMGLVFLACEDFMDTKNFTKQDDNSFPLTVDEANQLIVGVYNTLNEEISDYGKAAFFFNELASDERFGGGGTDNFNWQAISKLLNFGPDLTLGYWQNRYQEYSVRMWHSRNLKLFRGPTTNKRIQPTVRFISFEVTIISPWCSFSKMCRC